MSFKHGDSHAEHPAVGALWSSCALAAALGLVFCSLSRAAAAAPLTLAPGTGAPAAATPGPEEAPPASHEALPSTLEPAPTDPVPFDPSAPRAGTVRDMPPPPLERRQRGHSIALDLAATTLVPLSVGPELSVEFPGRVLAQVHLGWMPGVYSRTITNTLEDAGVYDETVGRLVEGSLESATTWRIAAGWRPFASLGLELWLGYAHVALAGNTTVNELLPLVDPALAERLSSEVDTQVGLNVDSSIDNFTAAVGWRWLIAEHWLIRANLGYMQAFSSKSSLEIESYPELTRQAQPFVNSTLHDHYMNYIKLPVVGLSAGYRFF